MTSTVDTAGRWAWAEIDLGAIEHNVRVLRAMVAPADVWAVVKADGYGHAAPAVGAAALRAGAAGLCVALVDEGIQLRSHGIDAPILVLSEQPVERVADLIDHRLTPTVYTPAFVRALAAQASGPLEVHVNVDTGMQRVGLAHDAVGPLAELLMAGPLLVAAVYTHLACADEPDASSNRLQIERLDAALTDFRRAGVEFTTEHAANSAAALALPSARRSLVRAGIAIYGISPGPGVDHLCHDLRPAMSLRARVSHVKRVEAGSNVSYGWRHRFDRPTTVATVPIGYADGVPRRLGTLPDQPGADVLIGDRRCPIVGVVTMDQFMVDVGDASVEVGDEVVLIGEQGGERIRAEHWAERLGTIGYEIVCGIGERVPRIIRGTAKPS